MINCVLLYLLKGDDFNGKKRIHINGERRKN